MTSVEIVDNPQKARQLANVLASVWGETNAISVDVIVAVVHSGGYASLATQGANHERVTVGGSLGFVGRGDQKLHSHVTGVVGHVANSGVGTALKQHQWQWAKDNKFSAISWTFDPLVRRNAHFNLLTLGAEVVSYNRDFYGVLNDLINGDDNTDRLVVERQVAGLSAAPSAKPVQVDANDVIIETPQDIVAMRRSVNSADQLLVRKWRQSQRASFESAFTTSHFVRGFTADGKYVISEKVD